MQISKWQHLLSFFKPISIKEIPSDVNHTMQLTYSRGQFKLSTPNVIYSFGKHYLSFGNAFEQLKLVHSQNIKQVLVLGWAMGSIGELLKHNSSIEKITAVEYDSQLVQFYQDNFQQRLPIEVDVICADAFEFAAQHQNQYDLVCSDIFEDQLTPDAVIQKPYLQHLNGLLKEHGLILLSKLNRSKHDMEQNKTLELNLNALNYAFETIKTMGNTIYYWRKMTP